LSRTTFIPAWYIRVRSGISQCLLDMVAMIFVFFMDILVARVLYLKNYSGFRQVFNLIWLSISYKRFFAKDTPPNSHCRQA